MVLAGVLQRNEVLGQLLFLERFLQACLAERAEREALLLDFDQAHLAESMSAV